MKLTVKAETLNPVIRLSKHKNIYGTTLIKFETTTNCVWVRAETRDITMAVKLPPENNESEAFFVDGNKLSGLLTGTVSISTKNGKLHINTGKSLYKIPIVAGFLDDIHWFKEADFSVSANDWDNIIKTLNTFKYCSGSIISTTAYYSGFRIKKTGDIEMVGRTVGAILSDTSLKPADNIIIPLSTLPYLSMLKGDIFAKVNDNKVQFWNDFLFIETPIMSIKYPEYFERLSKILFTEKVEVKTKELAEALKNVSIIAEMITLSFTKKGILVSAN